jgi:hypothetical protein
MNEQEMIKLNADLQRMLNDLGLGWINEQVNEQVRAGKIVTKEVQMFKEVDAEQLSLAGSYRPSGRPQQMIGVEPYTPEEQLQMLLDAIEKSMTDVAAMKEEIASFFRGQDSEQQPAPSQIVLDQVEGQGTITLSLEENVDEERLTQQLHRLIAQLRAEINS